MLMGNKTRTDINEVNQCLDDLHKEKKTLRKMAEQLAGYLIDINGDKDVAEEHINQIKGFIRSYQNTFENLELLESVLKKRLKHLQGKKK